MLIISLLELMFSSKKLH